MSTMLPSRIDHDITQLSSQLTNPSQQQLQEFKSSEEQSPQQEQQEQQLLPPRNENDLTVHRVLCQTILEPRVRVFSRPNEPFTEKYYDHSTHTIKSLSDTPLKPIKMQVSVHLCSKRFAQDVKIVFPALVKFDKVYAIPTFQAITTDMTAFTFEAGELKDHMLDNTMSVMLTLSQRIEQRAQELGLFLTRDATGNPVRMVDLSDNMPTTTPNTNNNNNESQNVDQNNKTSSGYFFDGVEPSTGLPYITQSTSSVYSEVEGAGSLLKYQREQAGACSLLKHPEYGLNVYPSTFFIAGFPLDELYKIILAMSGPVIE